MSVGEHFVNLIVVWNNYTEQKIIRYELYINKCYKIEPYIIEPGERAGQTIDLPYCEGVIGNLKITKRQAKELLAKGYQVTSGYSESGD